MICPINHFARWHRIRDKSLMQSHQESASLAFSFISFTDTYPHTLTECEYVYMNRAFQWNYIDNCCREQTWLMEWNLCQLLNGYQPFFLTADIYNPSLKLFRFVSVIYAAAFIHKWMHSRKDELNWNVRLTSIEIDLISARNIYSASGSHTAETSKYKFK